MSSVKKSSTSRRHSLLEKIGINTKGFENKDAETLFGALKSYK